VHLFRQKPDPDLYASPIEAANYYIERVRALADICARAGWPFCYFDADAAAARAGTDAAPARPHGWSWIRP